MQLDACDYPLIDTHAHLDFPPFLDNMPDTLLRLQKCNIQKVCIPAVRASAFSGLLSLADDYEESVSIALGLHPYFISSHQRSDLEYLKSVLSEDNQSKKPRVKAIGEIGLDAVIAKQDSELFKKQCEFFQTQLLLAHSFNLPVIIHSRQTHSLVFNYLKKMVPGLSGVIHGFSGSYEQALSFIKLGFMIGVGGVITYPRANKTRQAIAKLPLESMVLETDAPDMPPLGKQGQINRSENLVQIFNALCALRDESHFDIANTLWTNSLKLIN